MEYIYIGKIVNTHGIKGEIRLLSDFKFKERVFVKNMEIYIGRKKEKEVIETYRHHKNFEMITLVGYSNINEILKYKGLSVFVLREDLNLGENEYLDSDLMGFSCYNNNDFVGNLVDIVESGKGNKLFVIENDSEKKYVPYQEQFVINIDFSSKKIELNLLEGM